MRGNMRAERIRVGMTGAEVANILGVHVNSLYRWEQGLSEPKAECLVRLAKLYECSPDYLLAQTGDRHGKVVAHA